MGEIKSSWELAMERTAGIKSDKSSLRMNELKKVGQKIASDFMDDTEAKPKKMMEAVKEYSGEEKKAVEKAAVEILLSHISLPRDENYQERLDFVSAGLQAAIGKKGYISEIIGQISQFFAQFLQQKEQLKEQLKQQYTPQLRQKQQSLSQQYGYEMELKHEQDPEFNQLLHKHMQQLESQYQNALNEVKEQIRGYYGD